MNGHYTVVYFLNWFLLQFYDTGSLIITPKVNKARKTDYIIRNIKELAEKSASLGSGKDYHYFTPEFSSRNVPQGLYGDIESSFYSNENQTQKSIKNFPYKLAEILSAAGLLERNHSVPTSNNFTECICKPLGLQNSSDGLAKCYCSKEMQQKCEGVDLSYLLPIPGDTTTAKTVVTHVISGGASRNFTTIKPCKRSETISTHLDTARNGRGYRKVEESTLDALRKFQLTQGIFAPSEEEMEKAVEKAKIQLSKVKNDVPVWLKYFRHQDSPGKGQDVCLEKGKIIKDGNELYKILPKFKIERIINEQKAQPEESTSHNVDMSLLYQNAAAIKKQLETIRQYDILLANIRAQAQLRLIELADMETKHHIEEVRYKKERDNGLQELKNMEEVLRQEVKLARNLPGASNNWAEFQDGLDAKIFNSNPNEIDLTNHNVDSFERSQNAEIIQETVNRNNKLLEELDSLLHELNNFESSKEPNSLMKNNHRNMADDKTLQRYSLLEKALGRAVRNHRKADVINALPLIKSMKNYDRLKRKCSIKSTTSRLNGKLCTTEVNEYDKAFHNLQSDLMELKNQLFSQGKYSSDPQDNVLVQIKLSVDVANSTGSTNRAFRREVSTTASSKHEKINKFSKKFKFKY